MRKVSAGIGHCSRTRSRSSAPPAVLDVIALSAAEEGSVGSEVVGRCLAHEPAHDEAEVPGPRALHPLGHGRGLSIPAVLPEQHGAQPVDGLVVCQRVGQVGQRVQLYPPCLAGAEQPGYPPGWMSGSAWAASARTGRSGRVLNSGGPGGLDTQDGKQVTQQSEAVDQRWRSSPERARISPYRCLHGAEVATTALRVQLPQLVPPATPREDPCPVRPIRRERAAGDPGRSGPSVATISGPRRRRPNLRAR
jgi:hypothetical protein